MGPSKRAVLRAAMHRRAEKVVAPWVRLEPGQRAGKEPEDTQVQNTINELTARIQELQDEVDCTHDSRDFQEC